MIRSLPPLGLARSFSPQDGYNLPAAITPSDEKCTAPSCSADLNADCPAQLQAVRPSPIRSLHVLLYRLF